MKYFLIPTLWEAPWASDQTKFLLSSNCSAGNKREKPIFLVSLSAKEGILTNPSAPDLVTSISHHPPSSILPPYPPLQACYALHSSLDHTTHWWLCLGSYTFQDPFLISAWQNPTSLLSQLNDSLTFHSLSIPLTCLLFFMSLILRNIACCCFVSLFFVCSPLYHGCPTRSRTHGLDHHVSST